MGPLHGSPIKPGMTSFRTEYSARSKPTCEPLRDPSRFQTGNYFRHSATAACTAAITRSCTSSVICGQMGRLSTSPASLSLFGF